MITRLLLVLAVLAAALPKSERWGASAQRAQMSSVLTPQFWIGRATSSGRENTDHQDDCSHDDTTCVELERVLEASVEDGVSIDSRNGQGWSAITFAADHGDADAIELLAGKFECDVDVQETDGWTPAMFAAYHGDEAIVRRLVEEYDADVSLLNNRHEGVSTLLRGSGLSELAELVTKEGLGDAMERSSSSSPVVTSKILGVLRDSTAYPDHKHALPGGAPAAAAAGALDYGSWQNDNGWSPMHFCANLNDADCISSLLYTYGANINVRENDGWTPLMFAAFHGHQQAVSELLNYHGRLLRVEDNNGVFGSLDLRLTPHDSDVTARGLAQRRYADAAADNVHADKLSFRAVLEQLQRHEDYAAPGALHGQGKGENRLSGAQEQEQKPGGMLVEGLGLLSAVGTFIFGGRANAPKLK